MSRTRHHNERNHLGHEYGSRHKCNHWYALSYGKHGREVLHVELRQDDKQQVAEQLSELAHNPPSILAPDLGS